MLLPKKGDQLFITNKRGLTLLICYLKILTKLFQLRISKIFQDYISEQQRARISTRMLDPYRNPPHQQGVAQGQSGLINFHSPQGRYRQRI